MGYIPMNYDKLNNIESRYSPTSVKSYNNRSFAFWERALFQRALSVLEIDLPEGWDGSIKDFFNYCLYRFGYVAVFKHKRFGIVFQPCNLSGYDFWYQPTTAIISNPALIRALRLKIGQDTALLKLCPDYMGIYDVICYYAEKLSLLDNAINMSLINNKFAFLLGAKNKSAALALKKMLDLVNRGEPAVIFDKNIFNEGDEDPWQFLDLHVGKDTYLTTEQLADFKTIINNFDAEIGIKNVYEKKERLISSEVESSNDDAVSRSQVWLNTFNESAKVVNKLFGLNIQARRSEKIAGGDINELGNNNDDRDV